MKAKLEEIKLAVSSGEAALSEEDKYSLIKGFNYLIKSLPASDLSGEGLEALNDIYLNLYSSNLAGVFASNLKINDYFRLGEFLIHNYEDSLKPVIHGYLNLLRHKNFLTRIKDTDRWTIPISEMIVKSDFTFDVLLKQRIKDYGSRTFLRVIKTNGEEKISWNKAGETVEQYSKALLYLQREIGGNEVKAAFLMENSPEIALLDFACLSSGIVNVMIPANSVQAHIEYILNESKAEIIFVQNEKQLFKLNQIKSELRYLKKIILVEGRSIQEEIIPFDMFKTFSKLKSDEELTLPKINDLATIMYTSGTTGEPKGIMFSQRNIISKRFFRALALPEIGDGDRFLCYLPLFHTFGRYLELMGSLFWGAQYAFMENPSVEAMLHDMKLIKPTVFISIPKKWIQLYEWIGSHVNIELDDTEKIAEGVASATGGELKWGLSAAGFLPPEIFNFFQEYGVELLSGFGMTEATGGITMTPPGKYRYNSLGSPLPGIEIKIADDGELLIKGDYVMMGYYGKAGEDTFTDGWFPTGDIMTMDEEGYIEIIDRKKEIYKNIKGETIAPQKIENFFRDFETVKQVFLAGDHRPFNTVLIYPNYKSPNYKFDKMTQLQIQEYFSSVIVSINKFMAPFERILDFRLIERPFSLERGELTPKGTYKRRVIEKNFDSVINEMYQLNYVSIYANELEIRIPNWFLREKGCLSRDIIFEDNKIIIPKQDASLNIELLDSKNLTVRIGSFIYTLKSLYVDFQALLTTPMYWLGNNEFIEFASKSLIAWARKKKSVKTIEFIGVAERHTFDAGRIGELENAIAKREYSLEALNNAALSIQQTEDEKSIPGFKLISDILNDKSLSVYYLAVGILERPGLAGNDSVRRNFLLLLHEHLDEKNYIDVMREYLAITPSLIDKEISLKLASKKHIRKFINSFELLLEEEYKRICGGAGGGIAESLFNFFEALTIKHPTLYDRVRRTITYYQIQSANAEISALVKKYRKRIRENFRAWLGPNQSLAVDPETEDEYEWSDVIILEETISDEDKNRIVNAITDTPLIREAIFLFSGGKLIRLSDILPGGIWVSRIRELNNKKIFRASIQTRFHGAFDLVITLIDNSKEKRILDEINWLILAGSRSFLHEFVEDFGGFWAEYNIWTANFIQGESVHKYLSRESKHTNETVEVKLYNLFPFFVWNASAAYFNFWKLTDFTLMFGNTTTENYIVPPHDYQQGTKVISLSERIPFNGLLNLIENFFEGFVKESFEEFPYLKRDSVWYYIYSGLINSLGAPEGIKLLEKLKDELVSKELGAEWTSARERLVEFLKKIQLNGYLPKQLYFAIKRFHRWFKLNETAEPEVQASMLADLYETYNLNLLEETYPAVRLRFFKNTVFINSNKDLSKLLLEIIQKFTSEKLNYTEIQEMISDSGVIKNCTENEKFFLTRLTFPHLRPHDTAKFIDVRGQGMKKTNLVIQLIDVDGNPYSIRNPISPKEIAKLHQLFLEASLLVNFRPEHDYLVVISERGFIIGGLFFVRTEGNSIHMEKIVVSNSYRRKGVSEGLMTEFFNRAKGEGVKFITTGFFRPEYFYKFGFKIAPKYSGLVKELS